MKNFYRLLQIIKVVIRYHLAQPLLSSINLGILKPLIYLLPWHYLPLKHPEQAVRIRLALEDLGPIFVKFGQTLSTRQDLLPEDIGLELAKLQDTCPPFDSNEAIAMIERSLGVKIEQKFSRFDKEPLAAASIAQVHTAQTLLGDEVAIKVLRPHIRQKVDKDISLLASLARLIHRHKPLFRAPEAVSELKRILHNELDMIHEAANANRLAQNFKHSDLLYVPKVYWDLSSKQVLVSERIYGTPVNDIATLKVKGIDLKQLAENGVIIFFKQVFEHNFFHADMHPGNIFVGDNGQYHGVDFGIMGTLSEADLHYLSESFLGFFNQDYHRIALAHLEAQHISSDIDLAAFENALVGVCIPLLKKPLSEISFAKVLLSLLQEGKRFQIEAQPQLLLLDKTLFNVEGLGRQLYPELDLWSTAKPFLENLSQQKYQLKSLYRVLKKHAPEWLDTLPKLPQLSLATLRHLNDREIYAQQQAKQLQQLSQKIKQQNQQNRLLLTLICTIAAITFLQINASSIYVGILAGLAILFLLKKE